MLGNTTFKIYQRSDIVRLEWIQDFINKKNRFVNINLNTQVNDGEISKIFLFDINSRMGYRYDEVFEVVLKRKTNILRCLFVRSIFPLYIGLLLVGLYIGFYLENFDSFILISYALIGSIIFALLFVLFTIIHKYVIIPLDRKEIKPI